MRYVKAFIAGLAFPATFLPMVYLLLYIFNLNVKNLPLQFIPLYLPLVWGLWNILFFYIADKYPVLYRNKRYFLMGFALGLIWALFAVFRLNLHLLFNFTISIFWILITVPLIYGLLWMLVVKYLNDLLD